MSVLRIHPIAQSIAPFAPNCPHGLTSSRASAPDFPFQASARRCTLRSSTDGPRSSRIIQHPIHNVSTHTFIMLNICKNMGIHVSQIDNKTYTYVNNSARMHGRIFPNLCMFSHSCLAHRRPVCRPSARHSTRLPQFADMRRGRDPAPLFPPPNPPTSHLPAAAAAAVTNREQARELFIQFPQVCVCVCARARVPVCLCVCVCVRARATRSDGDRTPWPAVAGGKRGQALEPP